MYELKVPEVVSGFEEAISLHSQFGPIMYIVAKGKKPMFCYLVDPLNAAKSTEFDKFGTIHVTNGEKKERILLGNIQRIMFFGHDELIEILKSLLNSVDDMLRLNESAYKLQQDLKSKILDVGLILNKPWIKL